MATATSPRKSATVRTAAPANAWQTARERFLEAVAAIQRPSIVGLLARPRDGGAGLRMWIQRLANRGEFLPAVVPPHLVQVHLDTPDALPLHDCESCGLAVPVQPLHNLEADPQRIFFPVCPHCGGRTGRFAYFSRSSKSKNN